MKILKPFTWDQLESIFTTFLDIVQIHKRRTLS